MGSDQPDTRGVVLAGGRGSRLGGAKATADLAGKPLIAYSLAALTAVGLEPFIVAKPDSHLGGRPNPRPPDRGRPNPRYRWPGTTALKGSEGVEIVTEPAEPTHPLAGIVAALRHTGRPLVVLGCDFPFVPPALLLYLAAALEPLVVPAPGGGAQPLVARWSPVLLPDLEATLARQEPLRRTVASLSPRLLDDAELAPFGDPARTFFNVNTPADLRAAADLL
ncbi:MAG TPA: molybdenum cofactor guanylyltransferase [Solirubrobacterales bacterium]|nr:molybdenum cofactor guanylyltransferase [Solirubrobacterales bacterium]